MRSEGLYFRTFSKLKYGIQPGKMIYYNLCYDKIYGVEIIDKSKNSVEKDRVFISEDKDFAIEIIKYLYENAVGVESFRDVVEDLLIRVNYIKRKFNLKG